MVKVQVYNRNGAGTVAKVQNIFFAVINDQKQESRINILFIITKTYSCDQVCTASVLLRSRSVAFLEIRKWPL